IDYNTLSKMFNNQATQIKLDTLNKLCNALDCEITDILELS
ncbi:helix-turn-helix transcriptional regulator, partial [Clostridium botulinum]|nr:helix-turn-helix transcriptional regulator [Clostridium botulinum]NFU61069.1 helix-turn-helix transcriptional regulator [Clostridium botulinum]